MANGGQGGYTGGAQRPGMGGGMKTGQGGYMGAQQPYSPAPSYPGMQSATGPYMNDAQAPYTPGATASDNYQPTGDAAAPYTPGTPMADPSTRTGDAAGLPYYGEPTRLPPIRPPMQGGPRPPFSADPYENTPSTMANEGQGYTTAQTTAQWGAPQSVSNPTGGYGANTGIVPPGTGGIKAAPGYTPPAYDPSTDPLAQGGAQATNGIGLLGGGQFMGGTPYNPVMTPPGPGNPGIERGRGPTSADRRGMREMLQNPAIKDDRRARTIEAMRLNPNIANDPAAAAALRQQNMQAAYNMDPRLGYNANFQKVTKWGAPR